MDAMAMIGETLAGRYRLEREIGSGGMASVWRAHDEVLGRAVAAKLLHAPLANDKRAAERFRREAMLAAQISHPNMANVFDYVEEDGRPGIVMELVEGETLAARLAREGAIDSGEVVRIAGPVLEALEYAHLAGIVHRDIKPGNILLVPGGAVKVADFGIARAAGDSALTQTGTVMGTAHYAAPEQVRGEPATERSDLYALGAVMYEALTGRRPFEGETQVAVATARLSSDPEHPRDIRPEIPPAVASVVMRALARDPAERFATAAAMRAALTGGVEPAHDRTAVLPAQGPDAFTSVLPTGAVAERRHARSKATDVAARGPVRRRRFSVIALVAVAAAFAGLMVATRGPGVVTVPSLQGMSIARAEREATSLGLEVERKSQDSARAKGTVLRQSIAAGTVVQAGTTVTLEVSDGTPRCCPVPDLTGMTPDEAKAALEAAGLEIGKVVTRTTSEGRDGRVIDQNPRVDIVAELGAVVDLTIADHDNDDTGRRRGKGNDD